MDSVGYFSPFVPPEWIAAHGLRPLWLTLDRKVAGTHEAPHRGLCPCAGALVAHTMCGATPGTLVLTTNCDQMRYASAYLDQASITSTFLLNVPSTWQRPQVRQLYRQELQRLGRFLVQAGGCAPTREQLEMTIEQYHDRRAAALQSRPRLPARQWAETLVRLRSGQTSSKIAASARACDDGIPLVLIGGPLLANDDSFLELVEMAGGRIVVDGSEGGERTLPAAVDRRHLRDDPLDELIRIYFDTIPDVSRRPNTCLYEWLGAQLSVHSARGIILRRYSFCDLWHAELQRLRQWSDVPLLDIDVAASDEGELSRVRGRIEAFLEMLR
jgi:benzoyl-CoA reductase/2-hydroxyglutaryl-CoA dehydratase subunit BcrC/BadD/HgdB